MSVEKQPHVRRNLTLGATGLIAFPYAFMVASVFGEPRVVGMLPLAVALALAAIGWRELRTTPDRKSVV